VGKSRGPGIVDIQDQGLAYRVRLVVNHPSERLEQLTKLTGLTPGLVWVKGEPRFTPAGKPLWGTYDRAAWSYWEDIRNSRNFSEGVARIINALMPARDFLREMHSTGGSSELILELRGERNISDVIDVTDLARLVDLGIDLGIEVYPYTRED
jgi:uncharacterized protein DUF4279